MNDKTTNVIISTISLLAAVIMLLALSLAIGKWSFGGHQHTVKVVFPSVGGIDVNSQVKLAGAPIGRVTSIVLLPKADQTIDPVTGEYNFVAVTVAIEDGVDIGTDYTSQVKQDGLGIAPKYLLFLPGHTHDGPVLADGGVIQGQVPFEITDLAPQIGTALAKANHLLDEAGDDLSKLGPLAEKLGPLADKLSPLIDDVSTKLPPLFEGTQKLVDRGADVIGNLDNPTEKERLTKLLANLVVVTDNLKVVSSNSKALTETLAEKPWRIIFGGKTVPIVPESEVLDSNKAIPLKGDVQVEAATPRQEKSTHPVHPQVPAPVDTPMPRP